ncbi:hypothetical protein B0T17DRAFT_611344 [Bombardia bombarda]|uniref:FAD-binding PCMH-type domain-containing protein n=1 Tax=Bombardia bombarda TaxID=252184 RepID=A0AA39XJQ1_9PEZI|nr:hypothetical protein B0T17DRAFT_611344 [Bombardia bombarda]
MFTSLVKVAAASCLFQTALARIANRESSNLTSTNVSVASSCGLNWSDAAALQTRFIDNKKYGCKCYAGEACWPSISKWAQLNQTVEGSLIVNIPPGAACHNTFNGPLGTVNTYNAAECTKAINNWSDETWTVEQPAAAIWTYFTNDTCRPTTDATKPCTLGYYGVYVIKATKAAHIKAGVDFARKNNVRLIVRNTGHDFIGRSTGFGTLIINTHSFQNIQWFNNFNNTGISAVTIGAGVQGRTILTQGHAQNPPLVVVTGECPTVGIAGGFIQGGGHGPWTTLKGFSADNVLSFDVILANGEYATANAHQNTGLFWALKGGGPASYAVILTVTMRTYRDEVSSGATLYINATQPGFRPDLWEQGLTSFHKYSNHFVDNGLYVYFELFSMFLRARPFVGIGKTATELQAVIQPLLDELDAAGVVYEFNLKQFPTFFDLYNDLFEAEDAGASSITGGWMFNHNDVATNNNGIMQAFKTVMTPRADLFGVMIGHLFNPGHNVPVTNSATHPAWRNATNFVITVLSVPDGATPAVKADLQNILTNTMDEALRQASGSGCTYVNEADPYQANWGDRFWGSAAYARLKTIRSKYDPLGIFYAIATPGTEDWTVLEGGTKLCKKL